MLRDERQYSPGEAAVTTGLSRRTILAAISSGELAAARYNARVLRIAHGVLLAWQIARTAGNPVAPAQLAQVVTTRTSRDSKSRRRPAR